jgi:hypothetical protein
MKNFEYFFAILSFVIIIAIIVICFQNSDDIKGINFCEYDATNVNDPIENAKPFEGIKKTKNITNGQFECHKAVEEIFGKKFQSNVRPSWLYNPETKRNLELDCFNEELRIAIEYNGQQHYSFPNAWNKNLEDFKNQIRRDQLKKELCKLNSVKLIIVPYTIKNENIKEFIKSHFSSKINELLDND